MSNWKWGERSREILEELEEPLVALAEFVLEASPFDIALTAGHREEGAQTLAFLSGKSKLQFPHSKHNVMPARAMHLDPYPIDYANWKLYYVLAGTVFSSAKAVGISVRWGGDWDMDYDLNDQTFNDLAHWELVGES